MPHFLSRRGVLCSLVLGSLMTLALAGTSFATHPRPTGASPLRAPLVTAFAPCAAGGAPFNHVISGAQAGAPSCPPVPESAVLTNTPVGAGAGLVLLTTVCTDAVALPCTTTAGDTEDILVTASMTDVSCAGPVPPPIAPFCPGGAGTDYVGPVLFRLPLRLTDHASGPPPGPPAPPAPPPPAPCAAGAGGPPCTTATVVDFTFDVPVGCAPVGPPAPPGSTCAVGTSFDALSPGTVIEFQRMSYRTTDEIVALDPGPVDGMIGGPMCPPTCGTGDEGTYRAAGQFAP